eukprot:3931677-Rhodomonas_salina.2
MPPDRTHITSILYVVSHTPPLTNHHLILFSPSLPSSVLLPSPPPPHAFSLFRSATTSSKSMATTWYDKTTRTLSDSSFRCCRQMTMKLHDTL